MRLKKAAFFDTFYSFIRSNSHRADTDTWTPSVQLCCAVLGCWLTSPLNELLGRRGAIFVTALLSWLTCFWQGATNSWPHLFAARFVLGLGIGPKSSTVPVYSAECAPANIRGALVMMWQMWTAFGIMLGCKSQVVFLGIFFNKHASLLIRRRRHVTRVLSCP